MDFGLLLFTFGFMKYKNIQTSRIAGVLIIFGIFTGILSITPSVESENYLEEVFRNKNQVLICAIFQFLLVPIYIGFSLLLYPILKQYNRMLSVGFVGFKFMAGIFQLIGVILLPIFVLLSQSYLTAIPSDTIWYELTGSLLRLFRDLTNHLGVILTTGLGNLLLYFILYKEKLIPKWLSLWGIVGNVFIMLASFLLMFQCIEVISFEYGIMSIPLVLQEIILAIWLIIKGLDVKVQL